jgi:hypothetical protein
VCDMPSGPKDPSGGELSERNARNTVDELGQEHVAVVGVLVRSTRFCLQDCAGDYPDPVGRAGPAARHHPCGTVEVVGGRQPAGVGEEMAHPHRARVAGQLPDVTADVVFEAQGPVQGEQADAGRSELLGDRRHINDRLEAQRCAERLSGPERPPLFDVAPGHDANHSAGLAWVEVSERGPVQLSFPQGRYVHDQSVESVSNEHGTRCAAPPSVLLVLRGDRPGNAEPRLARSKWSRLS